MQFFLIYHKCMKLGGKMVRGLKLGMMIFPSVMNINAHGYLLRDGISL